MHGEHFSRADLNERTGLIIKAAMKVHSFLGPGLLESAYQACLAYELRKLGFTVEENVPIPLIYEELRVPIAYRTDLIVDDAVLVELKAIQQALERHEAQLQTQLTLGQYRVGLLINFHEKHLRDGICRRVNKF
jgi:GxxExxY protein